MEHHGNTATPGESAVIRNTSDKGCPNTGGGLKDGNGIAAEDTISALRRRDKKRGKRTGTVLNHTSGLHSPALIELLT